MTLVSNLFPAYKIKHSRSHFHQMIFLFHSILCIYNIYNAIMYLHCQFCHFQAKVKCYILYMHVSLISQISVGSVSKNVSGTLKELLKT